MPKAPSMPKALEAPKLPTLPKVPNLPKPKSGSKPPKEFLPGSMPGQAPYHGSGGHLPVSRGSSSHDHKPVSSARSCIHPKGMDRLRCEKADAVVGLVFAVIGLFLVPLLIFLAIRRCKRGRKTQRNRYEEDGLELQKYRHEGDAEMDCSPGSQVNRAVMHDPTIGLALTTSEETFAREEQAENRSSDANPGPSSQPAQQPQVGSASRDKSPARSKRSIYSIRSGYSSGMIAAAKFGIALSKEGSDKKSSKKSEPRGFSSDDEGSPASNARDDEGPKGEESEHVDNNVNEEDGREQSRSTSSSSGSSSLVTQQQKNLQYLSQAGPGRCKHHSRSLAGEQVDVGLGLLHISDNPHHHL